jgi:opacity protein-like surface antigen
MKKQLTLIVMVLIMLLSTTAATAANNYEGFSVGYSISDSAGSFGVGLEANSPLFIDLSFLGKLGFGLGVNNHWYQGLADGKTEETWTPYQSFKGGIILAQPVNTNLRSYGKFGMVMLLANSDIDSESTPLGIYGDFGFEFFPDPSPDSPAALFIEIGTHSLFPVATADKAASTEPVYFQGLKVGAGFRYYF